MADPNNILRSLPYPALEDGNLSFPKGEYRVPIEPQSDNRIVVEHRLEGAPLLQKLIDEEKAKYGCFVSVPLANYRKLHLSSDAKQEIEWDLDIAAEPPRIKPVIICTAEYTCKLNEETDGVSKEWQDISITIPRGARLASKRFYRPDENIFSLLKLEKESSFSRGCFEVGACGEAGFYFSVKVASDLFNFLQNPAEHLKHRKSIITHMISRCFEILAKDYGRDDESDEGKWEQYSNLRALAGALKDKKLPLWDEPDFSADRVATQYEPHLLPSLDEVGE